MSSPSITNLLLVAPRISAFVWYHFQEKKDCVVVQIGPQNVQPYTMLFLFPKIFTFVAAASTLHCPCLMLCLERQSFNDLGKFQKLTF